MSSPSVAYSESVLSHLEKVQQLPTDMQVDIAKRIEICIDVAKPTAGLSRHMFCTAMRKARNGPDFRLTGPCPNRRLSSTNDGFPPNSIWVAKISASLRSAGCEPRSVHPSS
jgi:hypothetical protein